MKAVDAYLDQLPETHRELGHYIREQVLTLVPGIEERFSFGYPFYHYFGMFLYISSAPTGINITFCRGKDLVMAFPQLQQKDRAIAASVTIRSMRDLDEMGIRELIVSAADWNRQAKLLKVPMVNRANKKGGRQDRR